jgi:hypothetical protein
MVALQPHHYHAGEAPNLLRPEEVLVGVSGVDGVWVECDWHCWVLVHAARALILMRL